MLNSPPFFQFIDVYLTMSTASTVYFAQPDWVKVIYMYMYI